MNQTIVWHHIIGFYLGFCLLFQVEVDMGEPVLKAEDVPTKLAPNKDQSVVKAKLSVDGTIWNVTCVSMGNPHCITFSSEACNVYYCLLLLLLPFSLFFVGLLICFLFLPGITQDLQVDELNLAEIGPKFEHHAVFPARTNTGN